MCLAGVRSIEFSRTMREKKKKRARKMREKWQKFIVKRRFTGSPRKTGYRLER